MRVMRGLGNMPYSGRLKQHGLVSLSMGRGQIDCGLGEPTWTRDF